MLSLGLVRRDQSLKVLCLGAHSDDIEIGCGGTLLTWMANGVGLDVSWCVLSAAQSRADEARRSAEAFLQGSASSTIYLAAFRDGFFPYHGAEFKEHFEQLKRTIDEPDVIFTHRRADAHQDHREVCKLTWNTFRNHTILEYEIPKWDGDLGQPNLYQPLTASVMDKKISYLDAFFGTQRSKDWFDADTFRGLARLRGMEVRAEERFAEAFYLRKASIGSI